MGGAAVGLAGLLAFSYWAALHGASPDEGKPATAAQQATSILKEAIPGDLRGISAAARKLSGIGTEALPVLRESVKKEKGPARLAAAAAVLDLAPEDGPAIAELSRCAREGTGGERTLALGILERRPGPGTLRELSALAESLDPAGKVDAALSWWRAARDPRARRLLLSAAASEDPAVRRAAILAAAQADGAAQVRGDLEALAFEPTAEGRFAQVLLERERLSDLLAAKENANAMGRESMLDEVIDMVQRHYVDERRVSLESLIDAAAEGIAQHLDKHCEYMTPDEVRLRQESFRGEYAGVGAQVMKDEMGYIQIETAFFGGPAYNAGIRAGDRIVKIEATSVQEVTLTEGVKLLRGEPGSKVTIEVMRAGWQKPQAFELTRGTIHRDSVFWDMLPGQIAYLRMTQFGEKTDEEMTAALDDLERRGMKALVVDLRANGGGLLDAAVSITSQFLKTGDLVTYVEGRSPDYGRREEYQAGGAYYYQRVREGGQTRTIPSWLNPAEIESRGMKLPARRMRPGYPVAILVDKGSASASEIFTGAMKAHGRAAVVGTTTYGKGSVQRELPLSRSQRVKGGGAEQARFKMTVAKYYLKDGVSIHGTGVKPDVEAAVPELEGWQFEAYRKLIVDKAFDRLLDGGYAKDKALYEKRMEEGAPADQYPGFAEWAASLKSEVPREALFRFFMLELRKRVANERGKPFAIELPLSEDIPLQRAVVELSSKTGLDLSGVKAYAGWKEKFARLDKEEKEKKEDKQGK